MGNHKELKSIGLIIIFLIMTISWGYKIICYTRYLLQNESDKKSLFQSFEELPIYTKVICFLMIPASSAQSGSDLVRRINVLVVIFYIGLLSMFFVV
jgi:hypothetical protein